MNEHTQKPWYRQFWLWFVLAPPAASIVLGLSLVTIAVTKGDSMVVDNYYKAGRALHKNDRRERAAVELGVAGTMVLDREAGLVTIHLHDLDNMPERLKLLLTHPTHAERDLALELQRDSTGLYRADARRPVDGRYYLRLEPEHGEWLLAKEMAGSQDEIALVARPRSVQ